MRLPEGFENLTAQDQEDYIRWASTPFTPIARDKKRDPWPEKFQSCAERALKLAEASKNDQRAGRSKPEPSLFEQDVLHTRFLLGCESEFDGASFYNPDLRETEVIRWFEEAFMPAGYRSALLLGDTGTGKTWAALTYLNSISRRKIENWVVDWSDSAFITAFRLSEMFANQKKFQGELDRLRSIKNLLIDDLGAEPSGYRGADFVAFFDNLFSERHMFKRRTIITTNATKAQIREVYGARFVSRFNDNGSFLETRESDMRGHHVPTVSEREHELPEVINPPGHGLGLRHPADGVERPPHPQVDGN